MFWIAIFSIYGAMSVVTIGYYGLDKYRAINGGWRIRERTLHTLEVLGGWPGAIVAQALFHHKRRKGSFMLVFIGIIVLHVALWSGIAWLWTRA